jgi:hypothetical protein
LSDGHQGHCTAKPGRTHHTRQRGHGRHRLRGASTRQYVMLQPSRTNEATSLTPPSADNAKPVELYHIIEHFCLGRRRLELFGCAALFVFLTFALSRFSPFPFFLSHDVEREDHNIRPGWLTVGLSLSSSNFSAETYASWFKGENGHLLGTTPGLFFFFVCVCVFLSVRFSLSVRNLSEIESIRPKSPPRPIGK